MISTKPERYSHKLGFNFRHFEWYTTYLYCMMKKLKNKNFVEAAIRKSAHEHDFKVRYLKVLPEHIPALLSLLYNMTDPKAFQPLKGRSS